MGMVPPTLEVSALDARRFMRRALLLDQPVESVEAALQHHGYVQIDPLNICGRMHDLILRNRVAGYREGDLARHLHGGEGRTFRPEERRAFEHHLPSSSILVAFPLAAWPHLLAAMKARTRQSGAWSGRLTPREKSFAEELLIELSKRGPLSSDAFNDGRRGRQVWGSSTLAKATLQKLFFHGRLLIARRENNRRFYDLPERVLPRATLAAAVPAAADTARWLALAKLRQRRLVILKKWEVPLVSELVQQIAVPDCPPLYCLREDLPLLELSRSASLGDQVAQLLAPLDPLIYDRRLTRSVWGFDYVWEAYTPAHKRVRGHYALPVLSGLEIVGHVEPKADRVNRKLRVASRRVRRGHDVAGALGALAAFVGCGSKK